MGDRDTSWAQVAGQIWSLGTRSRSDGLACGVMLAWRRCSRSPLCCSDRWHGGYWLRTNKNYGSALASFFCHVMFLPNVDLFDLAVGKSRSSLLGIYNWRMSPLDSRSERGEESHGGRDCRS
jgi:hypothetical protein